MPFIAAIIGYGTKIVAIKMMFEPIEFFGIKPFLGWQGIIPKKAAIMSAIACDTLTSRLIKPEEIFARLDPERVAQELEKIAPYMVSQKEFEDIKDLREVNNQAYVFLLINAVKELSAQIEAQQKQIEELQKIIRK